MSSGADKVVAHWPWHRRILVALLTLAALTFGLLWLLGWPGTPKIRLSAATTYLTAPVRADGTINYAKAIDDVCRQRVAPADNAWIDLLKAMGIEILPDSIRHEHLQRLGLAPADLPPGRFPSLHKYAQPQDAVEGTKLNGALLLARTQLWSPPRLPDIAGWLTAIEPTLDSVVAASRKSGWYVPVVVVADDAPLLSLQLPQADPLRQLGDAFCARAVLRTETGRSDLAIADLLAAHRLARLLAQGTHAWELQQGLEIERHACEAGRVLATSEKLNARQLKDYLNSLDQLAAFPSPTSMVDQGDRFVYLDLISVLAKHGRPRFESLAALSSRAPKVPGALVDWNVALTEGNRWYDRMVAAFGQRSPQARRTAVTAVGADLEALEERAYHGGRSLSGWAEPRRELGERVAEQCVYLTTPALAQIAWDIDRTTVERELTRLALALALHRADQGAVPAALAALVPAYLPAIPQDPFSGASFVYLPAGNGKGYLLYSVGSNERDDGARGQADQPPGDDLKVEANW